MLLNVIKKYFKVGVILKKRVVHGISLYVVDLIVTKLNGDAVSAMKCIQNKAYLQHDICSTIVMCK